MSALSEKKTEIVEQLRRIEQEEKVNIVYACESGSRAWGFPSRDSDYDVRFIYIRPVDWYLSITSKRDVIERPIHDLLDMNGWDLKKALYLFSKSNPPLLEWLQSPIQYMEQGAAAGRIRELAETAFSPKAGLYHYLHMARGNYREYLKREIVNVKKYFYVLRPLLACEWIHQYGTIPPLEFRVLVDEFLKHDDELRAAVLELLTRKMAGEERDGEPRIQVINDYLERQMTAMEQAAAGMPAAKGVHMEQLDQLFRDLIRLQGNAAKMENI